MNEALSGLTFAFGYLDDILVFSPDMESHLEHLRLLFERLRSADLKLKKVKCNFLKKHIQYLGHIVLGEGIMPLPEKLDSIQKCYHLRPQKKLNNFLVSQDTIGNLFLDFRSHTTLECSKQKECRV